MVCEQTWLTAFIAVFFSYFSIYKLINIPENRCELLRPETYKERVAFDDSCEIMCWFKLYQTMKSW